MSQVPYLDTELEETFKMSRSMSGVAVSDECITAYNAMQLRKSHRYMQMKVSDDKSTIVIEKQVEQSSWDDFISQLPKDEGRFVVYDYPRPKKADGTGAGDVLIFIAWTPDTAPVSKKMLYASSQESLKQRLKGYAKAYQCTDADDITAEAIEQEFPH